MQKVAIPLQSFLGVLFLLIRVPKGPVCASAEGKTGILSHRGEIHVAAVFIGLLPLAKDAAKGFQLAAATRVLPASGAAGGVLCR